MEHAWLGVDKLRANPNNPNEQDDRTFNALCASIQEEGWTQPLTVVEIEPDVYEIVGGHHRWEAAKVLGMDQVPCVLLDPAKFDKDRRDWNVVKQNLLQGRINPEKFARLYESLQDRYDAEVLQELMGFTSEEGFKKLYKGIARALPPDLAKKLAAVKDEILTIDGLSLVLNRLFQEYGQDLPSNVMAFSWGGKEVLWVLADARLWKLVTEIRKNVTAEGGDMSAALADALERERVAV